MSRLPDGFDDLTPFVDKWALPSENARNRVRWSASARDFSSFHAAMMSKLDEVLVLLAGYPSDNMPEDVHRLFLLTCAFAEASPHHELYRGSPRVPYSFAAERFTAAHGDAPS